MFSINELLGKPYIDEDDMREELAAIYGEYFVKYDSCIDDGIEDDDSEDDYVMKDCYSNDDNSLDIIVYYGNNTRIIENIVERKVGLA